MGYWKRAFSFLQGFLFSISQDLQKEILILVGADSIRPKKSFPFRIGFPVMGMHSAGRLITAPTISNEHNYRKRKGG